MYLIKDGLVEKYFSRVDEYLIFSFLSSEKGHIAHISNYSHNKISFKDLNHIQKILDKEVKM